jgi:molybdopterin converting factor small subunit
MPTVRYFAAARAAAGVTEERVEGATLGGLLSAVAAGRGDRFSAVLASASFLVDGLSWRDMHALLPPDATIDVLPPFAGG